MPDADIDAPEAWNVTTGSTAVTVAVIDTGIDGSHPDLSSQMWINPGENCTGCRTDRIDNDGNGYVDDWRGWDWVNHDNNPADDHGHGTHVAGNDRRVGQQRNRGHRRQLARAPDAAEVPLAQQAVARQRMPSARFCTPPTRART